MRTHLRLSAVQLALAALCGVADVARPVAAAEPPSETATRLLKSGRERIEHGEYDAGISALTRALPLAWESKDGDLIIAVDRWLGAAQLLTGKEAAGQKSLDEALKLLEQSRDDEGMVGTLKAAVTFARKKDLRRTQIRYLRQLSEVHARLADIKQQAEVLSQLLELVNEPRQMDQFCATCEQLRSLYQQLGDAQGLARATLAKGRCRELAGDTAGALILYTSSIPALKQAADKAPLAGALSKASEILRAQRRYLEALPLQQEAASLIQSLGDERVYAMSLNDLALIYQALEQIPPAVTNIEESLKLTRKAGTKQDLATSLCNAASIYRDAGRLDEGIALLNEVFRVAREEGLTEEANDAMRILATIHLAQGDYVQAAADEWVADDHAGRAGGSKGAPKHESHNLGMILIQLGKYSGAIDIFQKELKQAEASNNAHQRASAYYGLGLAYYGSERYTLAESNLNAAVTIYRDLDDPPALSRAVAELGSVNVTTGHYYEALDRYSQAERIFASMQAPQRQIEVLLSTSELYRHLKSYGQALANAQKALDLSEKHGFKMLGREARETLALVHLQRCDFEEAERLYRETDESAKRNSTFSPGLTEVYLETGRFREAQKELSSISAEDLSKADDAFCAQFYTQRGIAQLDLGQPAEAVADFDQAVQLVEQARLQFLGRTSLGFLDAGTFGGRVRPYRGMIETLGTLALAGAKARLTIGDKPYDAASAAFHFAELTHGRSLAEKLAWSQLEQAREHVPGSLLAKQHQLADRLFHLTRGSGTPQGKTNANLGRLQAETKTYLVNLEKNYPQYARMLSPSTFPLEELPLSKGEALLEYAVGLDSVFLFVVQPGQKLRLVRLPVSVKDLQNQVQVFRRLIVGRRFSPSLASDLFQHLLGGVVSYQELPERLIIVPDGFLGLLPFEALISAPGKDGAGPSFLGAQHSVTYAHSASVLAWSRNLSRNPATKPLFALADPIFSSNDPRYQRNPRLPVAASEPDATSVRSMAAPAPPASIHPSQPYRRLPETQAEVERVASLMGIEVRPPDVLVGDSATKSGLLKADLSAYRFIHFATHGVLLGDPGRINEPFLVLGLPESQIDTDGVLTFSEIMRLKLNAELVVLSACDTGGGDVMEGDGVTSLASAFQFAGAGSVVLALWEVPSEAAQAYMRTFYQYIKQGCEKGQAMRLSREAMRKQHEDPYYWAVFTINGGS